MRKYTTEVLIFVARAILVFMKLPNCDVCNGPELYGNIPELMSSELWRVELNPNQQHLGRAFVGLREHTPSLSEVSEADMAEFRRIVIALEMATRAAFAPDVFNWMCLMNNAKRDGQPTHVHWHMVPRYQGFREFNDHLFTDSAWPRQYNTGTDEPYFADSEMLTTIAEAVRRRMPAVY